MNVVICNSPVHIFHIFTLTYKTLSLTTDLEDPAWYKLCNTQIPRQDQIKKKVEYFENKAVNRSLWHQIFSKNPCKHILNASLCLLKFIKKKKTFRKTQMVNLVSQFHSFISFIQRMSLIKSFIYNSLRVYCTNTNAFEHRMSLNAIYQAEDRGRRPEK